MMPAISFQEEWIDKLLRGDKQQTTRQQTDRIKVGDVCTIYNQQRRRITDKPVRQMTGIGTVVMADRVDNPAYHYPAECPMMPLGPAYDMPYYYAHLLGKVEIAEVYEFKPWMHKGHGRHIYYELWAQADGFDTFASAGGWFSKRYGDDWMQKPWTVIKWNGWLERYFEPEAI